MFTLDLLVTALSMITITEWFITGQFIPYASVVGCVGFVAYDFVKTAKPRK